MRRAKMGIPLQQDKAERITARDAEYSWNSIPSTNYSIIPL